MCYNQTMNMLLQVAQSTYYYTQSTSSDTGPVDPAGAAILIIIFLTASIIGYVLTSLFLGRIFKKAGIASWTAWVPFYNTWKLLEIGGQPSFWAILAIFPVINLVSAVFIFFAMYNIGLKFGKSSSFVLFAIFLPIVWLIWLAFDSSTWNNTLGAPSKAVEHASPVPTASV
jgi:hypothetical protein